LPLLTSETPTGLFALAAACLGCGFATPASAQTAPPAGRAIEQAGDAFGVRVGVEQIGLYSETLVRGLNLQDSGNYRLGGAYFARAANLVDPILSGVTTRVGFNALGADFPAPTGVVEYGLRSPIDTPGDQIEIALREYGTEFYEIVAARATSDDTLGVLVGAQANLARSSAGFAGDSYRLGVVGEWRPLPGARLVAFYSRNKFDFEGYYSVTPTAAALPPPMAHPMRYVPLWGDHDGEDLGAGLIGALDVPGMSRPLKLTGSIIYSRLDLDLSEHVSLRVDENGLGSASIISNRPRDNEATAVAVGADWAVSPGHRLFGEVRWRTARSAFAPALTIQVDDFDLSKGLSETHEPDLGAMPSTLDLSSQLTAGVGYEVRLSRLRLKGGIQRAVHERTFRAPGAAEMSASQSPWLYDVSAAAAVSERLTLFATSTRGLEESGIAPNNAVNRNEVLPAVVADQQEIGLRVGLHTDMTLIASAFRIQKPAAAFDAAGFYRLSGEVEHKGLELSLSGRLGEQVRLLAGAAWLEARRAGELVDAGQISEEVPGVSRLQALAGFTWDVPWVEGLSIDGQASHFGPRRVRSTADFESPAYTTVNLGLRKSFEVADRRMALRLRVVNLFDSDAWVAQRSETLDRIARRAVHLSLSYRG